MKSEAAKGILRIVSNYARLGGNLILSLILVPFMLRWLGNDAQALVLLLVAGSGLAAIFREITDRAVIRELAAAHHTDDPDHFRNVFNSALVISAAAAGVVIVCFVGVYFAIRYGLLNVKPHLLGAAYLMVLTQSTVVAYGTLVSPLFNMQVVTERFVLYNFWTLADRASFLSAALFVRYGLGVSGDEAPRALVIWTILTSALELVAITMPMLALAAKDPRVRPAPRLATRQGVGAVFSTVRWYVAVEVGANLYDRAGIIFSNVFIGPRGNLVYGLGQQFVNYITQVAMGICQGLDAISARLESKSGRSLPVLAYHTTRLLALAALPVGLVFFVLAPRLIQLWVGRTIQDPQENVVRIAVTVQIMAPTITIRAIASGWSTILYGAGYLRRYAPLLFLGGVTNMVLTAAALLLAHDSSDLTKQYLIPGVLAVVNGTVYLLLLPRVAARCLGVRYRDLFVPLIRPLLATAACSPVLLLAPWALGRLGLAWNVLTIGGVGAAFGVLYGLVAASIVLDRRERDRFLWRPVRRVLAGRAH